MVQSRSAPSKKATLKRADKDKKKAPAATGRNHQSQNQKPQQKQGEEIENQIDLSATIPLTLQQLLLNVFKTALLTGGDNEKTGASLTSQPEESQLDMKGLIQTIKSHLYNRDFDSAFTDADEDLLRAYALRWSASRALGYAGVFKATLKALLEDPDSRKKTNHVVCIGGGAGAEIVALAGAWRDIIDESKRVMAVSQGVATVSLEEKASSEDETTLPSSRSDYSNLSVTAVDIADWSAVVDRLSVTIKSPSVASSKSHAAPLSEEDSKGSEQFDVNFQRADVLSLPDEDLQRLFYRDTATDCGTVMVTLMFTLNELFSTSMAKATSFLLRTTDLLQPGTILLVVDSPGSYSTLTLGKSSGQSKQDAKAPQERNYPMKFLLDHTLLSVAQRKWERICSQDSRWWRRDAARLRYDVGEGAGLEDMRYQIHIYRRLAD